MLRTDEASAIYLHLTSDLRLAPATITGLLCSSWPEFSLFKALVIVAWFTSLSSLRVSIQVKFRAFNSNTLLGLGHFVLAPSVLLLGQTKAHATFLGCLFAGCFLRYLVGENLGAKRFIVGTIAIISQCSGYGWGARVDAGVAKLIVLGVAIGAM